MEAPEPKSMDPTGSPFIDALVDDLVPVRAARAWGRSVVMLATAGIVIVSVLILATGPLRANEGGTLMPERLWLEVALGIAATVALVGAGLELGVPGYPGRSRLLLPALGGTTLWLALVLAGGTILPDLEGPVPSMLGKREHCFLEALVIGLVPALLLVTRLPARALSSGALCGALLGAAGATLPAIAMQIACMYEPEHALRFHLSPILLTSAASALLGGWLLRNR